MGEDTGRLHVLVERVIAVKEQLDVLDDVSSVVRARPPASYELLAQAHRVFDARALAMPRDYERLLRAHDGIEHVWRTGAGGSMSLFGHRELFAQRGGPAEVLDTLVVIASADDGEQVALVAGPTELPAVVARNAESRVIARFPSVTAWLEWILEASTAALERTRGRRRAVQRTQLDR